MTDKTALTRQQRAELCEDPSCKEHAEGDERCPIPLYKEDLLEALEEDDDSGKSVLEQAEPKTATGVVTRSE